MAIRYIKKSATETIPHKCGDVQLYFIKIKNTGEVGLYCSRCLTVYINKLADEYVKIINK